MQGFGYRVKKNKASEKAEAACVCVHMYKAVVGGHACTSQGHVARSMVWTSRSWSKADEKDISFSPCRLVLLCVSPCVKDCANVCGWISSCVCMELN